MIAELLSPAETASPVHGSVHGSQRESVHGSQHESAQDERSRKYKQELHSPKPDGSLLPPAQKPASKPEPEPETEPVAEPKTLAPFRFRGSQLAMVDIDDVETREKLESQLREGIQKRGPSYRAKVDALTAENVAELFRRERSKAARGA